MATSTRSRYVRLLFALALIFALMTPLAAAAQDPPDWSFRTETPHDVWSEGGSWDVGTPIFVQINDGESGPEFAATVEVEQWGPEPGDVGWYVNTGDFEIAPGDEIAVDDGAVQKGLIVAILTIDTVDASLDQISGLAPPNITFPVHASDGVVDANVDATSDGGGAWTADFGGEFDIRPGTWGSAAILDAENDATQRSWHIPVPTIEAQPQSDIVQGQQLEIGVGVSVEIDDLSNGVGVDWMDSGTTVPTPWDPTTGFVEFEPGATGFDVAAGQEITLSDGVTTKTLVVSPLAVADVDTVGDMVSGTASGEALLNIWADTQGTNSNRVVTAAPDGSWTADFSVSWEGWEPLDLREGSQVDVWEGDEDDDQTRAWFNVPSPQFSVETPNQIWSHGDGWVAGRTVTITVNDGASDVHTTTADVTAWGPNPWDVGWNADTGSFAMEPGHTVSVDDGEGINRTLDVVVLEVTGVDEGNDTITGTAPADAWIDAHAGDGVSDANRRVQASGTGTFTVDFGNPGAEDWEQDTLDLRPGVGGSVQVFEDDGDSTHRGWHVASPHFGVDVIHEEMWATDWPIGATLSFEVFEPDDLDNPVWSDSMSVVETPWGQTEAGYRFWGDFDVHARQVITITDGTTTRELIVSTLEVTNVDPDTNTYTGTVATDVDYDLTHEVCAWARDVGDDQHGVELCTIPEASGDWTIDFTGVGEIVPGDHTGAYQSDPDGDQTSYAWHVPPWIYVELGDDTNPLFPDRVHLEQWEFPVDVTNGIDTITVFDSDGDQYEVIEFEVSPFQTITATGSDGRVKSLYLEELSVDTVTLWNEDPPSTVYGSTTATYDGNVQVTASATYGWWTERWVEAVGGSYEADFANPGNGWREQELGYFGQGGSNDVIETGGEIRAHIYDSDNDQVQSIWHSTNPRIVIVRGNDRIEAIDFPLGEPLTIELDDPAFDGIEFSETGVVGTNPDKPWETLLVFDLGEYTVPDQATVTAFDEAGTPVETTEVIPFTIDDVDPDTEMISGTAPEGTEVLVEADGNWRYPIANELDTWTADFSVPGDRPGEENPVDIGPGSSGGATLLAEGGSATTVLWSLSAAVFWVDPQSEHVWGTEFAPDASVTVAIDTVVHGPFPTDGYGNFDWHFDVAIVDIVGGTNVVVSDGETEKTHEVTALGVTGVDDAADTVSGVAAVDSEVHVWINETDTWRNVVAGDGTWLADFAADHESGTADLSPGSSGGTHQCDDDGDCTQVDWQLANPVVYVEPSSDGVWGHQWAADSTVDITIAGTHHSTMDTNEWGDFGEGWDPMSLDIVPGMTIEVTQGDVTKTHVVTSLAIVGVDTESEVMTGTADGPFDIWVHDTEAWRHLEHTGGTWSIDWSVPAFDEAGNGTADLEPGSNGNSNECDDDGDCTWASWNVANPAFSVETPHQVWSHGEGWVEGSTVTLVVDDDDDPNDVPLFTDTIVVERWGPEPWDVGWGFDLTDRFEIVPDLHHVTVDDGVDIAKGLWVDDVTITSIDEDADIVTGTAPAFAMVEVNAETHDHGTSRSVEAGADGVWTADFSVPGDEEHQQDTFDIGPDTWGSAQVFDEDGDSSQRSWNIEPPPNPAFSVETPFSVWSHGDGWVEDRMITLIVDTDDDPTNGGVLYMDDQIPVERWGPEPWDVGWSVHLEGLFEIVPGHFVSVYDGVDIARDLWVEDLEVTEINEVADTISGTAPAGTRVEVHAGNDAYEAYRSVDADDDGNWFADFSNPGDEGHEQDVFDIAAGTGGAAQIFDEDGDSTHRGWQAAADSAVVEGHVYLGDEPLPDVEVWSSSDGVFTCTGGDGYFRFDLLSPVDDVTVATGPSYSDAGCGNSAFVDPDGMPLLVAGQPGIDLTDGYEYLEFNVEYAAAIQFVRVEDVSGGMPAPVDGIVIAAYDRNDPDFIAEYGHDPDPSVYQTIAENETGELASIDWTGAALDHEPGLAEMRYPYITDVLILAELDPIQGAQTNADEFVENNDGIVEGPEIVFQIGEAGPIVTVDDVVMGEGDRNGRAYVKFHLSEPLATPVTVVWTTEDGTAIAGEDYKATSTTFAFRPGSTTVMLGVQIHGDTAPEDDEYFSIVLLSVAGASAGEPGIVTLLDDDESRPDPPELTFSDVEVLEGNRRDVRASVNFVLSSPATKAVTFTLSTSDGTALAGSDYYATTRTIAVPAGATSVSTDLRIIADTIPEPDEHFFFELLDVVGATLGDSVGEVTIVNDD